LTGSLIEGGANMSNFSPEYRATIGASLKAFVNDGDDVACIGYFVHKYGQCKMCEHVPIKWHYVLENLRSHQALIIGSECVENYQVILSEWGYRPEYIVFPGFLRPYSRWILEQNPNAVVFDDGIVMRFQADCGKIIRANSQPSWLQHYRYVKRSVVEGAEEIVGVDESGRQFAVGPSVDYDFDEYVDFGPDEWDLCGCGVELSYCEECDNEMCPECGRGCTCDDDEDRDYMDDEEEWE
jgi:hypothetical protein